MKAVVVLLLLSVALSAQGPQSAGGEHVGWWCDLFADPRVSLTAVLKDAERWRGRSVRFDLTLEESIP
jgi:hypothetical protein